MLQIFNLQICEYLVGMSPAQNLYQLFKLSQRNRNFFRIFHECEEFNLFLLLSAIFESLQMNKFGVGDGDPKEHAIKNEEKTNKTETLTV